LTFAARIAELNRHDDSRYLPFLVSGARVGSVRRDRIAALREFPGVFAVAESQVSLAPALATAAARTEAMARAVRALYQAGAFRNWRDELYAVVPLADRTLSTPPLFEIDRAAVPFFGIRAFGIHVNGFVRDGKSFRLWIARRSDTARIHPGKLDNMVAGGQPASLSFVANMMKEAEEEASIAPALSKTAVEAGYISYCVETPEGLGPATMFVFDLDLPRDFTPVNADGELAGFELLSMAEVLRLVEEDREFKPNSNLVILDFCLRHGVIGRDHPEYQALISGLRQ
jgi:8-oxo-dGTP pyrophosphatase MutT (NUDIX family)